jgi:hypothetical protein
MAWTSFNIMTRERANDHNQFYLQENMDVLTIDWLMRSARRMRVAYDRNILLQMSLQENRAGGRQADTIFQTQ